MNESISNQKKQMSPAGLIMPGNWRKVPKYFKGGNDAQREQFVQIKRGKCHSR